MGSSRAIWIPKEFIDARRLADSVELSIVDGDLVVTPSDRHCIRIGTLPSTELVDPETRIGFDASAWA